MNRRRWIFGGIGVLVLGLLVATWFATHKQVKKEVRHPPTGEARQNPYLALERILTRAGLETTTRGSASEPEEATPIFVLVDRRRRFSPEQVDQWREWVRDGGHLVLTAPPEESASFESSSTPLLEAFSVVHAETPEDELSESTSDDAEKADDETPPSLKQTYEVAADPAPLEGWSAVATDWRAFDADGNRIAMSLPASKGRVTLIADAEPFRNASIGDKQHAQFAWNTITLGVPPGTQKATIVQFSTQKSWLGYAGRHTWPFLVALAVVLLAALNAGRWQFGPELPTPSDNRRSRVEHIRATGEFLWEHRARARLLESTRTSLLEELAERRPSLADAPRDEQKRIVEDELDLDSDDVRLLFDDRNHVSETQFRTRIELMERYRRTL